MLGLGKEAQNESLHKIVYVYLYNNFMNKVLSIFKKIYVK